ncbi:hypothetical protein Pla108_19510 [Botrimarina colliarenosi]|uniref:Uncharacterized protein n=1 Tax=Botrimarina colliarenosi TaxID=2528001 RepID=A0A5C6ADV1_9BACT|nr:hypothetical protein [Botrimarina colliarenosi]TWT97799.1 hypothetical protein Pla108_19510 [Botrimarina colliarenosi]
MSGTVASPYILNSMLLALFACSVGQAAPIELDFESGSLPVSDGWIEDPRQPGNVSHQILSTAGTDGKYLLSQGNNAFGWFFALPDDAIGSINWLFEADVQLLQLDAQATVGVSMAKYGNVVPSGPAGYQILGSTVGDSGWKHWQLQCIDGAVSANIDNVPASLGGISQGFPLPGMTLTNGLWFGFANNSFSAAVRFDNVQFEYTPLIPEPAAISGAICLIALSCLSRSRLGNAVLVACVRKRQP